MSSNPALRTTNLSKRFGANWALRDCSLDIEPGTVTALIGANGAGKTTLLNLATGLTRPTSGTVSAFGHSPRSEPAVVLPRIGFVAQDHPLYPGFTVAEVFKVGRRLNPRWDQDRADRTMARLGISMRSKASKLSGGQQAQVALTLALAKRPDLLILDEPVAALDPLARREFLASLMQAAAETGLTVLLSSHIVEDLERVCDHLVILAQGVVQLTGSLEETLAAHRWLTGPRTDMAAIERTNDVIHQAHTQRQTRVLVRTGQHLYDARWQVGEATVEEIVLAYLSRAAATGVAAHIQREETLR